MRNYLENIKVFIGEIIGLIGGLIWAYHTNWDYEPVILICLSILGITIFILLRLIPSHEDRPIVEMEFVFNGAFRSPPDIIANVSPKEETGQFFVIQDGGTYLFKVGQDYNLVIRNNSKNNAYNLTLFKLNDSFPLIFRDRYNPLEPLVLENPKSIGIKYQVYRPMTHQDAEKILSAELPNDLSSLVIVAKYQSESRQTYYTKFKPMNQNEHFIRFPQLNQYSQI